MILLLNRPLKFSPLSEANTDTNLRLNVTPVRGASAKRTICSLSFAFIVLLGLNQSASGRSICENRGPALPKTAGGILSEADGPYMAGIRLGRALGALGEVAIPEIRNALKSESHARQRVALYALGELSPNISSLLADILPFVNQGGTREVRLNALNALGKFGAHGKGAVPIIIPAVRDSDGGISTEARRALVKIGFVALPAVHEESRSGGGFLGRLFGSNAPFSYFEGPNDNLKALYPGYTIAEENKHYGRIKANLSVDDLVRIISSSSSGGFDKDFALKDLARIGPQASVAIPALLKVLRDDPSDGYRGLAAQAIGSLGSDALSAVPALAEALDDCDVDVRFSAAWALASVGGASVIILERALNEGTPRARLSAIRALEMIYSKSSWRLLMQHWLKSDGNHPYDDQKLKSIVGEPR